MLTPIDKFLNSITMYKLVLYVLEGLVIVALGGSLAGVLPYSALGLLFSTFFILLICYVTNQLFAWIYKAPTNAESIYISALILVLLINPPTSSQDMAYIAIAFWASIWAMASKYIFAVGKKHIFNPVAFGILIPALFINQSASWWIGTLFMMPFVVISGILITRKIRRTDLVLSFLVTAVIVTLAPRLSTSMTGASFLKTLEQTIVYTPLLFFAFLMLTEPLTTPPTRKLRITYGILTGILYAPAMHIGSLYSTPELALIVSNVFSYAVSPKQKLILILKEKILIARDTYDFVFNYAKGTYPLKFKPGQYLEWMVPQKSVDSRGNRRYFTLASSPTENTIRMGIKFYPEPSSFKKTLHDLKEGNEIIASQLAGDFTLPHDPHKKLVFIAGGIGVTPFRSMIKYLIDTDQKRDIVFFYSNKLEEDIAYKELFDEAKEKLGIKVIYSLSDKEHIAPTWKGERGAVNKEMILSEVPDFKERMFYISGPNAMVEFFSTTLTNMGVSSSHIKKDFFPGFA